MADPKRMSEAQARTVIKEYEYKQRIRARIAKEAKERGDPPPSGPVFRPRTIPLQSREQYYKNAQAALKYHEDERAASLKQYTTPLPARTRTPPPTDEEFRGLLDRLGVERPVKKAKGGLIKARKKSSIDGIARKGHTKAPHR
jgi:hypothetical protein